MAKKPTPAKKRTAFTPLIGAIAAAVVNRGERKRFAKEDKAYQAKMKEIGRTVAGGGRANVKPKARDFRGLAQLKK
tara:strand:- start:2 stop:229 length:228 start_codon:yes stop_codon:yes gene_type:complete